MNRAISTLPAVRTLNGCERRCVRNLIQFLVFYVKDPFQFWSERLLIFLTAHSILFAGLRQHGPHDFGNSDRARCKKRVYLGSKFRKTKSIYKTLKGGVQNG